ncbi:MAG: DNA topoisomerase IB [Burkholderiales bacterium]
MQTSATSTAGHGSRGRKQLLQARMALAHDPAAVPSILRAPPPPRVPTTQLAPPRAAKVAGLRYVNDLEPGIGRRACGKGHSYFGADARAIKDKCTLARIRALAIPPAWREVWICARENGHVQATGRDARGRKQYIYHQDWVAVRDANKFARLRVFGKALAAIRRRVAADLALPGIPREKVLALILRLLDSTLIRIGNEEYARANGSYGLTTLRSRHVDVHGSEIQFQFRGKSGISHRVVVAEPKLARVVRRLLDLPGQELFQYADETGALHTIDSADVNDYLRAIAGDDFSAKDFRTWYATRAALQGLERCPAPSKTQARAEVKRVLAEIAKKLGNTPAICRKSYVHPAVIEAFMAGQLPASAAIRRGLSERLFRLLARANRRPCAVNGQGSTATPN